MTARITKKGDQRGEGAWLPHVTACGGPMGRKEASTLIMVIMILAVLALGLGTYLQDLGSYRRIQGQRMLDDQALMAAEAGVAEETGTLVNMATLPTSDITQTYTLPSAQFAPFENVTVAVHQQTANTIGYWTITSTAVCDRTLTRGTPFARRVQVTIQQQNFAKYELFTNNYGGVWTPGYLQFMGLGQVYMGPININSGVAFWPDFWSLGPITSAASGGVNVYSDYNSYVGSVYGSSAANNAVNILQYWDSTYPTAPQFYGGLSILPTPIALPTSLTTDPRSAPLVTNAGLTLPDGYTGYSSSAGPNFAVTLSNGATAGNSTITVQQYLGTKNGAPSFGPTQTTTVNAANGDLVVKGNIVSLSGTLSGRLTIAALAASSDPSGGNVNITGNLVYNSQVSNPSFQYPNPSTLINSNGTVNNSIVTTLQSQLNSVTDILGIVSEGNVMIQQNDLYGNPIAASASNPLYIDAIVMATGVSTSTPGGGGFGVQNELTRPPGQAYFLGGMIQNVNLSWALYNGSGITNGLAQTELWDKRVSQAGGTPPFFPITGNFEVMPNSWNSSYVQNASTPTTYPSIP